MPFYEYKCPQGHVTTMFFRTFSAAENQTQTKCDFCMSVAERIVSAPLGFGLYGDPEGYTKPSATKRHSTKLIDKKGNS